MTISLIDNSLKVNIFFEISNCEFGDNVCFQIIENCPDDEKVFRADETNLYLTAAQTRQLVAALLKAAEESEEFCK